MSLNKQHFSNSFTAFGSLHRKWERYFEFRLCDRELVIRVIYNPETLGDDIMALFLRDLAARLRATKTLQKLVFDLTQHHSMRYKTVYAINKELLPYLKSLRSFKLYLSFNVIFANTALISLCKKISKYCRNLETFAVEIYNRPSCTVRNEDVTPIVPMFAKSMRKLKSFKFNMPGLAQEAVTRFLSLTNRTLISLEELSLKFLKIRVLIAKEVNPFEIKFSRGHRKLKVFDLFLSTPPNFAREELEVLSLSIAHNYRKLQDLKLAVVDCEEITDKGVEALVSNISRKLTKLRGLSLDFTNSTQLTDKALKAFGPLITPFLNRLKDLSLNFTNCDELSDQGFLQLLKDLSSQRLNFDKLSLNFSYCKRMSGKVLKKLPLTRTSNLTNLKSLNLNFMQCGKFSNDALTQFGTMVNQYTGNLQELSLELGHFGLNESRSTFLGIQLGNSEISDTGLAKFSSILGQGAVKLARLNLRFEGFPNISDAGVQKLSSNLNHNLRSAKKISLKVQDCGKGTQRVQQVSRLSPTMVVDSNLCSL